MPEELFEGSVPLKPARIVCQCGKFPEPILVFNWIINIKEQAFVLKILLTLKWEVRYKELIRVF